MIPFFAALAWGMVIISSLTRHIALYGVCVHFTVHNDYSLWVLLFQVPSFDGYDDDDDDDDGDSVDGRHGAFSQE